MASSFVLKIIYLAMMIMCIMLGQISSLTQGAPTCGKIRITLAPCLSYLRRNGDRDLIPRKCCHGVKKVNHGTKNKQDRQSVCKCIKRTTQNVKGLNLKKLANLPQKCGVKLPYKLSPSMDCNNPTMATSISVVKVTYLTMLIMCITLGQMTQAVELCGKIDATLVPCVEYLSRNEHIIPQSCCDGVKNLNAGAKSKEDRQSVCNCIRRMTKNLRGLKPDKLAKLPEQCGVKLPYKLSPSMDCTE
ncbi:hypothetical protein HN51_048471 [Arachis hypogaea]